MILSHPGIVLEVASASHPGKVRSHNEDSIAVDAEIGLAVLADGMGGYHAGEVASSIAVATVRAGIRKALGGGGAVMLDDDVEELVAQQVAQANAAIYEAACNEPRYSGMGTTLVMALWYDGRLAVGHVGDSRLYRLRGETFAQITRDHSLVQEQLDSGMITREQARHSQYKNLVTRAVGIEPVVAAEVHTYAVEPGDIYLLCSDGLSDMLDDEDIRLVLLSLRASLPLAAERLVRQANDNGGRDNISVVLVRVVKVLSAQTPGLPGKPQAWLG
ncbi:MAG: Stp1/IreP family PP2C-type Ser/Thr phosphatase [Burkholderiales bacterium]